MNADKAMNSGSTLLQRGLSEAVLRCFYAVYNELGPGFLESVYENALRIALVDEGMVVVQQMALDIQFRGRLVGEFRADLVVEGSLIIEVKAVAAIVPQHEAQLIHYLKATGKQVGLVLNFGPKPEFRRKVWSNAEPPEAASPTTLAPPGDGSA